MERKIHSYCRAAAGASAIHCALAGFHMLLSDSPPSASSFKILRKLFPRQQSFYLSVLLTCVAIVN